MAVPAARTLSPGKPVTIRWQIFALLVPLVVLGLIAVPVLVDRGLRAARPRGASAAAARLAVAAWVSR